VRDVSDAGSEVAPFAVAVMLMSPTDVLNADPELVTIVCAPDVAEIFTRLAPAVTVHVVPPPPLEVRVTDTG
jgi:hypothetical protein